ncbi:MAG: hypothetical protein SGCHY_003916, partial [Lobulomycetales sp.]
THLAPSLATVAILGIFSRRVNGQGALCGLLVGFTAGVSHYVSNLVLVQAGECPHLQRNPLKWLACLHFNDNALLLGFITAITTYGVSLLFPPPAQRQLEGVFSARSGYMVLQENEDPEVDCDSSSVEGRRGSTLLGTTWNTAHAFIRRMKWKDVGLALLAFSVSIASIAVISFFH